ncbi:DnaJ domain-containing protein [Simiduia sp. 21SJ11W-1]|uniref:J domain-containing protein n=1 Tax=Simiduia sp. 21SJ11W-1 TaxID=2909669 RepID=UPI00209DA162|nr:DnaJ domain-containing protein [Simiduia sp. 21SJ11W-1]UTA47266.1 DnaJ domain-containing protein [Simiduia sp. 21SJ11W-1]
MLKKYYSILGLPEGANADVVKRQYRRLAMQHHPDRTGGRPSDDFLRLCQAYDQLRPHLKTEPAANACKLPTASRERRGPRRGTRAHRRFSVVLEQDYLGTRVDEFA